MQLNHLKRMAICATCLFLISSCKKDRPGSGEEQLTGPSISVSEKNVTTFQIVTLQVTGEFEDKYTGSFLDIPIDVIKSSDSTLSFIVPDAKAGEATLKIGSSTLQFNVGKTTETDATEFKEFITNRYTADLESLQPVTPEEIEDVERIKKMRDEVLTLFNSLSPDLKRQAIMTYEANKEVFRNFRQTMITDYDAPVVFGTQSSCPRIDFKSFYNCTAQNLSYSASQLKQTCRTFIGMLALAGISAYLAPASAGLALVGGTLATAMAGYLLFTEVLPAALEFKSAAGEFLGANWIFTKNLFLSAAEVFKDQISTDLKLKPSFRSVTEADTQVSEGTGSFIGSMSSLRESWDKLKSAFGDFPAFRNQESSTTLSTDNLTVSNISNSKVQYLGNDGQLVRFKSLSGNEESFTYNLKVTKEGFTEEKTLSGTVIPLPDSTEIFAQACVGTWTVQLVESGTTYQMTLNAGGSGYYHPSNIAIRWEIRKSAGKYYLYEYNFWNSGFNQFRVINTGMPNENLTYPVTGFIHYGKLNNNPINESLRYTKN